MTEYFEQYYRCLGRYNQLAVKGPLSESSGYFWLGEDVVYGRYCGRAPARRASEVHFDACRDIVFDDDKVRLPFDLTQVADNFRYEQYSKIACQDSAVQSVVNRLYYYVRPLLTVNVRKHLQRIKLKGWDRRPFPHWPVDRTVDNIFEQLFLRLLRTTGAGRIPFIWFWPDGAPGAIMMTHDVETQAGRDFCGALMDVDESVGIAASFQVVPEVRYEVPSRFLRSISERGFEVCVQDLNHDGRLYANHQQFLARAARINQYGREWGAQGFRGAVLYRKQEWFNALDFSYDMSVPNVAHLDPQHGGCCTVMPYFVGKILELPVTTIQDYSLFNILNDYSIDQWRRQIELVLEKHGLASFIVHPDYVTTAREMGVYKTLLAHLAHLRDQKGLWVALPGEVNRWWRQRAEMTIIEENDTLRIEGAGSARARIAFASEKDGQLVVDVQSSSGPVEGFGGKRVKSSSVDHIFRPASGFQVISPAR
jgi:hypothetical protein